MAEQITVKKSKNLTLFNPSFIDDYGFTPFEFRVFSRIMRRALGSEKDCFESIPSMAQSLQISEIIVRQSINVLVGCNAITRIIRAGYSDLLDFNTCDQWIHSSQLEGIRNGFEIERKRKDRERLNRLSAKQVVTDNAGVVVTDNAGVVVTDNAGVVVTDNAGVVVTDNAGEGNIDKSILSQQGNHTQGNRVSARRLAENPHRKGISLKELVEEENAYLTDCLAVLEEKRMDSPLSMPEWYQTIAYTEKLSSQAENFKKSIEAIEKWANGRITPKMVADNFGKFLNDVEKNGHSNGYEGEGCEICNNHVDRHRISVKEGGLIWCEQGIAYCVCHPKHKNNRKNGAMNG